MCVYSMIVDTVTKPWADSPWIQPLPPVIQPVFPNGTTINIPPPPQAEIEKLRNELEALKKLLKAAKIFDTETGQPDCEHAEKVATLKRIAEWVGVDIADALPN